MSHNRWSCPHFVSNQPALWNKSCEGRKTKYIFVSGGLISGIGKGVTTSVVGAIMKGCGYNVTAVKIDPYVNIDAGTFSPYEHGEVYVLDDGGEVDLDLGNYERLIDVRLTKKNNITTGKIYDLVIHNERKGFYLGKTVQIIPHITDAIQEWIKDVVMIPIDGKVVPDICLIEVGGVVGDIESMPFLEAIRQFQSHVRYENYCHLHVTLLPTTTGGELKTKPTQASVRHMRGCGIHPDFIICRSSHEFDDEVRSKISLFCDVAPNQIISVPDVKNTYQILPLLYRQNLVQLLSERLLLSPPTTELPLINEWIRFAEKSLAVTDEVVIAIVGKYTKHGDAYHSVSAALSHSALFYNRKIDIKWIYSDHLEESMSISDPDQYNSAWQALRESQGIVIPGGFDKRGFHGKLIAINYARINKKPILGICLGLQVMVIEYARNILRYQDANSTEIDPDTKDPVIIEMPEFNPEQKGGTMRLGLRKTIFKIKDSHTFRLYEQAEHIYERHRHRYEMNLKYRSVLEQAGLRFVGVDESNQRMEIIELSEHEHPYFVGVQYHPEFLSRPLFPSPVFRGLIQAAITCSLELNTTTTDHH